MKTLNKALLASTLMVASTASFAAIDLSVTGGFLSSPTVTGPFSNTFDFDLSEASNVNVTLTNHLNSSFLVIDSAMFTLADGSSFDLGSFSVASGEEYSQSFSLAAGTGYSITVSGTPSGTFGGHYTVSAFTSPVPEASTLSLMMAGFGLIGLMS
jgi:hypothetical protein